MSDPHPDHEDPVRHPWEVSPTRLVDDLASDAPPLLLDCREPSEAALARIDPSILVPMGDVAGRLPDLQEHEDRPLVVYCHHGVRSLQVVAYLRSQGFEDVRSLAGGIERWSLEVDPSIPRY